MKYKTYIFDQGGVIFTQKPKIRFTEIDSKYPDLPEKELLEMIGSYGKSTILVQI